jgi:hypothetical protein
MSIVREDRADEADNVLDPQEYGLPVVVPYRLAVRLFALHGAKDARQELREALGEWEEYKSAEVLAALGY